MSDTQETAEINGGEETCDLTHTGPESNDAQTEVTQMPPQKRVVYAGVQSAKQKLVQRSSPAPASASGSAGTPKRITPPRDGVAVGVLESTPVERDPNVVVSSTPGRTMPSASAATAATRARFREMERLGTSLDLTNGEASQSSKRQEVIPVNTKSLRDRFLAGSTNGEPSVHRKINPAEEIEQLYRKQSTPSASGNREAPEGGNSSGECGIENDAAAGADASVEEGAAMTDSVKRTRASDLKQRFTAMPDQAARREFKMELGEGGVYESNPQERQEDVVASESELPQANVVEIAGDSVKSNLQKFRDLQTEQARPYQTRRTEPLKLDYDRSPRRSSGVPKTEASSATVETNGNGDTVIELLKGQRCANEAKRTLLERQKQFEDEKDVSKKTPPKMIDIWQDLCSYSGVFENEPKLQDKEVIRHPSVTTAEATAVPSEDVPIPSDALPTAS